jgi:hypothetical protein
VQGTAVYSGDEPIRSVMISSCVSSSARISTGDRLIVSRSRWKSQHASRSSFRHVVRLIKVSVISRDPQVGATDAVSTMSMIEQQPGHLSAIRWQFLFRSRGAPREPFVP